MLCVRVCVWGGALWTIDCCMKGIQCRGGTESTCPVGWVGPPAPPFEHSRVTARCLCCPPLLPHTPRTRLLPRMPLLPQGRLTTAMEYLEYVPGEASTTVAELKDRIFRSGAAPLPQVRRGWVCIWESALG